jgi:hypothetical protein
VSVRPVTRRIDRGSTFDSPPTTSLLTQLSLLLPAICLRLGPSTTSPLSHGLRPYTPRILHSSASRYSAKKGLGSGLSLDILCRVFELTSPRNAQKRHYKSGVRTFRHAFFCTAHFFFFFNPRWETPESRGKLTSEKTIFLGGVHDMDFL